MDQYHGRHGAVSWQTWTSIMAAMDQYHGSHGPVSWQPWTSIMADMDQYHGSHGPVSWQPWTSITADMDQYHGSHGPVSWQTWTSIMAAMDQYHGRHHGMCADLYNESKVTSIDLFSVNNLIQYSPTVQHVIMSSSHPHYHTQHTLPPSLSHTSALTITHSTPSHPHYHTQHTLPPSLSHTAHPPTLTITQHTLPPSLFLFDEASLPVLLLFNPGQLVVQAL